MTVRIVIEAETVREALEEARGLWMGQTEMRVFGTEEEARAHAAEHIEPVSPETVPAPFVRTAPPVVAPSDTPRPTVADATPPAPPTPTASPAAAEVDSRGIPWDARVHAGNKATSKDGAWKKRRNVDPALHAKVEAELKATAVIPAIDALPTAAAPPPPPPATEPPPVNFGKLLATANNDITVLDEAINTVSKGEFTTIAQVATLPAWIQAVYDHIS
jgi:hypothetical protein